MRPGRVVGMSGNEAEDRLDLALRAAREAGRVTLRHFARPDLVVETKPDRSPVTVADRDAETTLRELIAGAFPEDAVLGEEHGEIPGTSGYRWVLDPIDGTKTFVQGVPLFGTLVGVEKEGEPVLGVIHLPALDETVYGVIGAGAWWIRGDSEPLPARVSGRETLPESVFCTTSVEKFEERGCPEVFNVLRSRARLTRTWGDCYGYALVATGRAEVMIDPALSVWDACALVPVLREAGGTFTDWRGRPTIHGGEGVATNGRVLEEVLAVTRGAGGGSR
jgi:histidinol-phosphatase